MAIEARRGCGYRKVGGLYLVGSGQGETCCKLPIALHVCPTCNQGIKQSRGWQWIAPQAWLRDPCTSDDPRATTCCPAASPEVFGERVGLIWIGEKFYSSAEAFMAEGARQGISRRISALPRDFVLGETWVFFAHPKVVRTAEGHGPGIFHIFRPTAVEKIVTESQSKDADAMADLRKQGITPVIVPDDDLDHQGSCYDDKETAEPDLM